MLHAATSPPKLFTLILLTGLSTLSLNMFLPSLANMAADFQVDYSLISVSVAGYLAITAVLQIIIGPMSDLFGRRPVILAALVVFIAASAVCAVATNIWVFLAFRTLQGAMIAGWAISLAVIRDTHPPQEAASRIGYVSMAMAIAPMLGPVLGGVLDDAFGWRASFITYLGLGLVLVTICWFDLGETNQNRSPTFKSQFQSYPELVRSTRFWGYAICMALSTGSFYTFLAGAPLVATKIYGMSAATLGLCIGSITCGFMFGSFLSGRFSKSFALTTMMITGRLVAAFGLLVGLSILLLGYSHVFLLFGSTIFVGIGNGLTMPSSNSGAMSVLPHLTGSAAGLSGALTVGGGAILTSITGVILTEENGAHALLTIMLITVLVALAAAVFVRRTERLIPSDA